MADFTEDINVTERLARSIAEKERSVTDANEISEFHQARAHLHNTYLILCRINKQEH